MGMTPLEGLVMGTRSGDLDPAIVGFIGQKERRSPAEVGRTAEYKSQACLESQDETNDMRELQKGKTQGEIGRRNSQSTSSVTGPGVLLAPILLQWAVPMRSSLPGGIGENSPDVRASICEGMEWAGLSP